MTQTRFVFWPLIALVASSLGPTQGFTQVGPPIETVEPTSFTVVPNVFTPISMKTLPEATCVLHAEGEDNTGPSLTLFADDEGTVRFHVRPPTESDQAAHVEVDCDAGGKTTRFPLHLRPNSSPTPEMPPPAAEVKKSRPGAYVRPALSDQDAVNLTTEELVKRGYPPRPDRDLSPEAFGSWLKAVTHPSTFVPARSVAHPEIRHSTRQPTISGSILNSSNWSGFSLSANPNQNIRYDLVSGEWYVPSISPEWNNSTFSAYWVGLDGQPPQTDLWQAGTEQDIAEFPFGLLGYWVLTAYDAWTEFLPLQPTEQVIPNFVVNPGDDIRVSVWIGNAGQSVPSLAGADGIAQIENLSRSEYTTINTSRCTRWLASLFGPPACINRVPVPGITAEWIMERPTLTASNGTQFFPDLADYSWTYMLGALAGRTDSVLETYSGFICQFNLPCVQNGAGDVEGISMFNGSDLLSIAQVADSTSIYFTWQGWH